MSIRRFPPPPESSSTPKRYPRETRSTEAPMDYEFETPRTYPGSPFGIKLNQSGDGGDGERARKRTHYEAMDVDTPPRADPIPSFSTAETSTANPFHFSHQQPASPPRMKTRSQEDVHFEAAGGFSPNDAFGLATPLNERELAEEGKGEEGKGKEVAFVGGFKGEAKGRRRKGKKEKGRSAEGEENEDAEEESPEGKRLGRRMQGSKFSFQVHHHHAPSGSDGGVSASTTTTPERWLHSATPYTLLGYLQFGSLTLLTLLFLSLSIFFLQTLYHDIQSKLSSLTLSLRSEIHACAKAYFDNKCQPESRLPFMEARCLGWEECMGQEVKVEGKSKVVAETIAEVFNGFFEVISFKTMLFILLSLSLIVYTTTVALSHLPSSSSSRTHLPPPPLHYPISPYHQVPNYHPYGSTPLGNGHDGAQSLGWGPPPSGYQQQQQQPGLEKVGKKKGWF